MKFAVVTFGCRVNQADSHRIEEELQARGATSTPSGEADLVIVNTCSVTATADQGARQTVRRIARENPAAKIVMTGCYATRSPDELAALPGVALVIPNERKHRTLPLLEDAGLTTAQRFSDGEGACGASIEPGFAGRTTFTLRVQTGCEQRCAYCIIPSTRGRGRSLPVAEVLREALRASAAGFREIILTGVHLGSYGRDLQPTASLLELLQALDSLPGDVRYRLSSLEPMDCTPAIVDLVCRAGSRFAPHFHLPLQHASDRMLREMRRPYTLAAYSALVRGIVDRLPHASIGSDVIVGFPGETGADFERNAEYLAGSPLSHLHVFPYSDRPGTAASGMPGKLAGPVVRARGARIRGIGAELARRFQASQVGTVRPALTLEDGEVVVTDNYMKVRIPKGHRRNEQVHVRLTGFGAGHVVDSPSAG